MDIYMHIKFKDVYGCKVYYKGSEGIAYLVIIGDWGLSPFTWYGTFNPEFSKLAVL